MDTRFEYVIQIGTAYNAALFLNKHYSVFEVYFGRTNHLIIKKMVHFLKNYLWFLFEINYQCFIYVSKETLPMSDVLDSCVTDMNSVCVDNVFHDLKLLIKLFIFLKDKSSFLNELYLSCDKQLDTFLKEVEASEIEISISKKEYSFIYFDHLNVSYLKEMMGLYFEKHYFCQFDYSLLPIVINE